jgi:hypothetical protein
LWVSRLLFDTSAAGFLEANKYAYIILGIHDPSMSDGQSLENKTLLFFTSLHFASLAGEKAQSTD